jgi:hypothetical protein
VIALAKRERDPMHSCPRCGQAQWVSGLCTKCTGRDIMQSRVLERQLALQDQAYEESQARLRQQMREQRQRQAEAERRWVEWALTLPDQISAVLEEMPSDASPIGTIAKIAETLKSVTEKEWLYLSKEKPHEGPLAYQRLKDLLRPQLEAWYLKSPKLRPSPIPMIESIAGPLAYKDLAALVYMQQEYPQLLREKETEEAAERERLRRDIERAAARQKSIREDSAKHCQLVSQAQRAVSEAKQECERVDDPAELAKEVQEAHASGNYVLGIGAAVLSFGLAYRYTQERLKDAKRVLSDSELKSRIKRLKSSRAQARKQRLDKARTDLEAALKRQRELETKESELGSVLASMTEQQSAMEQELARFKAVVREERYDSLMLAMASK